MSAVTGPKPAGVETGHENSLRRLTPLLVWAVVFCDIGTSVYYVPGILYKQGLDHGTQNVAPAFVLTALLGFLFLASKYVEICWRNPEGGGVVSVATNAFTPLVGCIGGLLICVDYFLTSAISSVSGINYLASAFGPIHEHVILLSIGTLTFLAVVNTIGIRESAILSLVLAAAALGVDVLVIVRGVILLDEPQWRALGENLAGLGNVAPAAFVVGFSGAWLAFSGLESISQLSPAMKAPIQATAKRGMRYVVITVVATSPVLTLFAIALLGAETKAAKGDYLISEFAGVFGGGFVKLAVVVTASSLLLFAANTAIIGSYHVFLALAENGFLPKAIARRNRRFRTPHIAIVVATVVPISVILMTQGDMEQLGSMYSFGLLGCFVLSSGGLDVLRWRSGVRGWRFALGLMTTGLVLLAFSVNFVKKQEATAFGLLIVGIGLFFALGTRRRWFVDWFYSMPSMAALMPRRIEETEQNIESRSNIEVLSLTQAESISRLYPSSTLVALRSSNPRVMAEAILRERGRGGSTLYVLFVEERTGLFVRVASWEPKTDGLDVLRSAVQAGESEGMTVLPVWTISYDAVEGIVRAADSLGVSAIMIGATQRSSIYHLLRGHVLAGLAKRLPAGVQLLICG